jgi:hypothetical protein
MEELRKDGATRELVLINYSEGRHQMLRQALAGVAAASPAMRESRRLDST